MIKVIQHAPKPKITFRKAIIVCNCGCKFEAETIDMDQITLGTHEIVNALLCPDCYRKCFEGQGGCKYWHWE